MTGHVTKDQAFINKLTQVVLANLRNEYFGVKELASESGISQYSLSRRLRSITNKTINQFINEIRLQKAFEMLQNEELNASEVAYKTGFSSPAYFTKCFHDFYGYPPGIIKQGDLNNIKGRIPVLALAEKEQKKSTRIIFIYTLAGFFLLIVFVYLIYNVHIKNSSVINESVLLEHREKSIAVLPFKNLSSSLEDKYFIEGVMDEILSDLSRIHDLSVRSRTSVEQFRESIQSAYVIGKKLDADYLVEGSGQKYGNKFSLRVQLIEASSDKHIWAHSFEEEINATTDIIRIQSQIAQSIAAELKAVITPEEKQLIEKIPTSNLSAYDFYQRGNDELRKHLPPEFNPEAVKKAEAFFLKALEYDSTFAQAYAGLADVLWIKWDRDYTITESIKNKLADSMLVLANIALSYDNQLSYAYVERGGYYEVKGIINQAIEEYDKALKYNPNDWIPYAMKGFLYGELDLCKSLENFQKGASHTHGPELIGLLENLGARYYLAGFPEKGNYYFLEVLKLDGDSVKYNDNKIRNTSGVLGNYKEAAKYFENRYLADSTDTGVLASLGRYYAILGQNKESLIYYKKYLSKLKVNNQSDTLNVYIGYAYLQNGYRKEANYYFNRTIVHLNNRLKLMRPGQKIYDLYALAQIYACRGDKAQAYENLRNFNQNPSYTLRWVTTIKNDPIFNSIRNESEFQKILKDVEAKYQAEHERVRKWLAERREL